MNTAIILAAGKGSRMNAGFNKQYIILKDKPILAHTIEVFQSHPGIDDIILVVAENEIEQCKENIVGKYKYNKVSSVVVGAAERQGSVYNGIKSVNANCDIVLIHDGARPLITSRVIGSCIEGAIDYGAVSVGVPIKETVKILTKDNIVSYTPNRKDVWVTQTPQAFKREIIIKAHEFAIEYDVRGTDDAMLVEHMGLKVKMVEGDYDNIKITTPEDLITVEAIMNYRKKTKSFV